MAKANITLPDGTRMVVDGSAEEITALVKKMKGASSSGPSRAAPSGPKRGRRLRLVDHIDDLVAKGFFRNPRGLSDVRDKLREMGHVYPLTTLSPAMLTQVRRRVLRRTKDPKAGNRWKYVQ
jgi:hypothetical protein